MVGCYTHIRQHSIHPAHPRVAPPRRLGAGPCRLWNCAVVPHTIQCGTEDGERCMRMRLVSRLSGQAPVLCLRPTAYHTSASSHVLSRSARCVLCQLASSLAASEAREAAEDDFVISRAMRACSARRLSWLVVRDAWLSSCDSLALWLTPRGI